MSRTTGKEVALQLSNFVNSGFGHERTEFIEVVTTEHRYLQQEMFKMFLGCIEEWALANDTGRFDPRNEYTVKASKAIIEALKEKELF